MNGAAFDPGGALALAGAIVVLSTAIAIMRARSLLAVSVMLAVLGAALAVGFLALDAPDLALAEALIGAAFVPIAFIGAMLLTTPSARKGVKRSRIFALGSAIALACALLWAASDLPAFGDNQAGNLGRIFVNRAWGEAGVRNAVAVVSGNYRALDALAQLAALMGAGLGAFALLGFGERAGEKPKRAHEERA